MEANASNPLGRTGLSVTMLGCGGTWLARVPGQDSATLAARTMQAAWDAGVRYYDTAPSYGFGLSEHRLGEGLRRRPREDYVLSTKIGRILVPCPPEELPASSYAEPLPFKPVFRYDYDGVMRSFEDSLQRLGTHRVDILLVHDLTLRHHRTQESLDRHTAELFDGGGYKALEKLRDEKVIGALGGGLGSAEACVALAERGDFDCFLLAQHYTLLDQDALDAFLPLCERRGIAVIMGGVYNTGILASGPVEGAWYDYRPATPAILDRVRRVEAVCRRFDTPLAAAALQFPLHHPAVVSVVIGMSTPEEVKLNVDYLRHAVPAELYETLKSEGLLRAGAPIAS